MSTELAYMSLAEAARRIAAKELSPVDYVTALIHRIEAHDHKLDAFLKLDARAALARARAAEADLAAARPLGALHGVPFALKDIIDAEGLPTTAHSKILEGNVARADAEVTRRLKAAGGNLLGKLSTHEFAIGGPCFDLPWPPARNPWNREAMPGGSSSGSGAAVAAGFVPAALGSDTGGSVRNPASCCALVGMKATYGRVSRRGVIPLSFALDHVGPLTRDVRDNALMLNLLAGHDALDPGSARAAVPDFTAGLEDGVEGLRVGVIRHFYTEDMVADPEMAEAIETGALTRERLAPGAFIRAVDYVQAVRTRKCLADEFRELMANFDVVVTASSMHAPGGIEDAEEMARTYSRQARPPFNVTGSPALVLPTGFTESGLPLSMQIVGKPFDEAMVYRVAHAYEQATPWKDRRPPLEG